MNTSVDAEYYGIIFMTPGHQQLWALTLIQGPCLPCGTIAFTDVVSVSRNDGKLEYRYIFLWHISANNRFVNDLPPRQTYNTDHPQGVRSSEGTCVPHGGHIVDSSSIRGCLVWRLYFPGRSRCACSSAHTEIGWYHNRPLTRYVKLRIAHASSLGMLGTLSSTAKETTS